VQLLDHIKYAIAVPQPLIQIGECDLQHMIVTVHWHDADSTSARNSSALMAGCNGHIGEMTCVLVTIPCRYPTYSLSCHDRRPDPRERRLRIRGTEPRIGPN
jgi:hypothetical protein